MTPSALSPASAHDIILEILRNMKDGLELLYDTVVPPAVYRVYLHRDDLNRLRGIIPRIVDEARQALSAEIAKLNEGTLSQKLRISRPRPIIESLATNWIIEFLENTDEGTQPGDIVIYSELALPPKPEYSGSLTKRTATRRLGRAAETTQTHREVTGAETEIYATIEYEDNNGRQIYQMTKNQIVIGRGGSDYWTDLTLHTLPDVSREHLRLRRDPVTGKFFLKDLSRLGTTIDGKKAPSSLEEGSSQPKDKNVEVEIPKRAKIGLAGVMFLNFEAQKIK
jgi:hypothetical protein